MKQKRHNQMVINGESDHCCPSGDPSEEDKE